MSNDRCTNVDVDSGQPRRGFLGTLTSAFMFSGLVAGYGAFVVTAGRFLFPTRRGKSAWQFVATLDRLKSGESLPFETPSGEKIVVARQGDEGTADSFIALSSVCPHLGCAVHWESQNDRFFCPCHNGAFDASGKATAGPARCGQSRPDAISARRSKTACSISRFPLDPCR